MSFPLLRDAYDLHLHPAPDVPPRSQRAYEFAKEAAEAGMAGAALKSHVFPTVMVADALNQAFPDGPEFFGTLTLNAQVGGVNPLAVKAALEAGGRLVWFPTFSAAHHQAVWGSNAAYPLPSTDPVGIDILDEANQLRPHVLEVVDLIAKHDAVLATGHLSVPECRVLLKTAADRGVRRRILTHVTEEVSRMDLDSQREIAEAGAFIEHSFMAVTDACPGRIGLEEMVAEIEAVGPEKVILTSDFGQVSNGPIVEGFGNYLERLIEAGISEEAVRCMIVENPKSVISRH